MKRWAKRILIGAAAVIALLIVLAVTPSPKASAVDNTVRIAASPDRVWKILADLPAVQRYSPVVAQARYITAEREGIGAARHCDLKPRGYVRERIVGWEPPTAITMELYESEWPVRFMRWRTALQPDGSGTLVTQHMEYQFKFGLLGWLLDHLAMKRKLHDTVDQVFAGLKGYAESGR